QALGGDVRITVRETDTITPGTPPEPTAESFTGTVTFNGATLTRATGNFATAGFLPGTTLRVTGGTPYDGYYTISAVGTTTLTLSAALPGVTSNDVRTNVTLAMSGTTDESLDLEHDGSVRFVENVLRTVPNGRVSATGSVLLRVGDDVTTTSNSQISAGTSIDIYGDWTNGDTGYGTTMTLRGDITPGASSFTQIWGDTDVDTFH